MESDIEHSEIETTIRALKTRMVRASSLHLEQVNARTSIVLQMASVLKKGVVPASLPPNVLAIVNDPQHSSRITGKEGPLLFYRDASTPDQICVVDIASVLLSSGVSSRAAAVSHVEAIAIGESPKLTSKTRILLEGLKKKILDENPEVWQPAALEAHDTIVEDLLYQLAAVEQSVERRFEEGLREHFPKVLCPSLSALEGLELRIVKASDQKSDLATIISTCVEQANLHNACDSYMYVAGFIPLADDYSLARLVELWDARHPGSRNLWELLWEWADKTRSPLARYHVCMAFVQRLDWCSQGQERVLWQEILEIISSSSNENDTLKWRDDWTVRKELAQHYLHFLESRSPGALGEPLACFAWWLADRVACLIGSTPEIRSMLRNIAIIPEAENSDFVWRLSLPRIGPSMLARLTHSGASPWAISTLGRITPQTLKRLSPGVDEELASQLNQSLAAVIMFGVPLQAEQAADPVYAFENNLSETVRAWRGFREGSAGADKANGIASMYAKLANPAEFVAALKKIDQEDNAGQMIISFWAKSLALQDALPHKDVLKCISDAEWRRPAFAKMVDPALDQMFLAFSLVSTSNDKGWHARLSHLYAMACEEIEDNPERRRFLFALTALSGIHGYSVSALQRLLTSERRSTYLELLSTLRNNLTINRNNPFWLTARIRAVLAATAPA